MTNKKNISPWAWVPTLYFAEGIPYFLVNSISVMMFTKMGVPNGEMALFTSLLYLPWTIKPFWSPFVDMFKTKRWWIIAMQVLMTAAFVLLTITIPHPSEMIASDKHLFPCFRDVVSFILVAFASATHDIAADGFICWLWTPSSGGICGHTFYILPSFSILDKALLVMPVFETKWEILYLALTLLITVIFGLITLWHVLYQNRSRGRRWVRRTFCREVFAEFGRIATYFKKPGIWLALVFMLVYRLPEAFLIKMINPFLVASRELGGLALSVEQVGIVYGTIGILFLTIGGILGGIFASCVGLKKSMWVMAVFMTLPCLSFVYLSVFQPTSLVWISVALAIEQFGYGFGFTAYMLFMMYFSEGEFKTAHYAICTAFMALSMMIPGMFAGYLQEWMGYEGFFWMVIACCSATLAVTVFAYRKIDAEYGLK